MMQIQELCVILNTNLYDYLPDKFITSGFEFIRSQINWNGLISWNSAYCITFQFEHGKIWQFSKMVILAVPKLIHVQLKYVDSMLTVPDL